MTQKTNHHRGFEKIKNLSEVLHEEGAWLGLEHTPPVVFSVVSTFSDPVTLKLPHHCSVLPDGQVNVSATISTEGGFGAATGVGT